MGDLILFGAVSRMMQYAKEAVGVNWRREIGKEDIKPALKRYRRYLEDNGLRASTIPMYVLHASKYLEFIGTDSPCADDFARFRDHLHDRKLSRSTINDYSFSIKSITKCSDKVYLYVHQTK